MPERDDAITGAIRFMGHRASCSSYRNAPCNCGRDGAVAALRAAQPEAGSEEAERLDERARINARYAGKLSAERDEARAEVARLRAAHPEADRAPVEEDAVARAIHEAEHPDGSSPWETLHPATLKMRRASARAALAALRSEQGQSRDDTVTLAEAEAKTRRIIDRLWTEALMCEDAMLVDHIAVECKKALAALDAVARFGAGRAEREDRDTENER